MPNRSAWRTCGLIGAALLVATACDRQPDAAQLQRDLSPRFPGCRVIDRAVGEGDADHVYIHAALQCTTTPERREIVLGYGRHDDRWAMFGIDDTKTRASTRGR
jgi:hypothetical protein